MGHPVSLHHTPTVDGRPLLEPWEAYVDFSGRLYYYNTNTGATQWERPVAPPTGLCAKHETELSFLFRNAPVCTPDQICPDGLICFYNVDFTKKRIESTPVKSTKPPTVESTKPLTDVFTMSEPSVLRCYIFRVFWYLLRVLTYHSHLIA